MLASCSAPPPSQAEVKDAIIRSFEERGYRVVSLELGGFAPQKLKEKVYMGAPAYTVEVKSIVLQSPVRGSLEFHNGSIQIVEKTDKRRWEVSRITDIPVQ